MNIELSCPACADVVVITPGRSGRNGRRLGSCRSCRSMFSLYGGRLMAVDTSLSRLAAPPKWTFGALVQRERPAALACAADLGPAA